ncbi:MAG: Gfo/Idh/MocA family oxidoreductase [Geminicoccaceae bacterium]|nr:Gfo/Idh/MocA family oxidoreductase [Geminicoccaceae bacterium]MCB9945556.1 Gfo/Idh/MocA family oxidoreductase [Geminicoccaceae bacterium]
MSKDKLRVGLVGYGFMGKAHSNAYRQVGRFFDLPYDIELKALAARNIEQAEAFAGRWGYGSVESDWRRLVERDDIDMIDICAPNHLHKDIAIAAAQAGKWVLTEKPLAMNVAEGEAMVAAVESAGVPNMVWYNYRRLPSVSLAHLLVEEGFCGRPFHYRAQFLQDWTMSEDVPQGGAALWRLDASVAGSGVTGDLLAHNIDTAMWLNGPVTSVSATTETFIKERVHQETGKKEPVEIDDAAMVMARFANGSLGLFESTRYARGHKALKTFELNGMNGSLAFDLHEPEYLELFEYVSQATGTKVDDRLTGWRKVHVTNFEHPYMDHWWVPGLIIGYEHSFTHALADFLDASGRGEACHPTFRDALETQRVCDAILASAKSGTWHETGVSTFA